MNIFIILSEMAGYNFLVRAVTVGALVSVCAALLGVSLVLKRYSMIGDGLSHVGFGSLALATALNAAPLLVSIPLVTASAFLLLRLSENSKIKGDAAIALISTAALAIGVFIISKTTGMNTDVCNYLFGSILAMSKNDVYLSIVLSITVLVLFLMFYHKIFAITFDETFARASGVNTKVYNTLSACLTAITVVLGMRMMGAMLISSLIIFPALTSMRVFKKYGIVTVCAVIISIVCFFIGVVISYVFATPTGASVVIINIAAFLIFWAIGSLGKYSRKKLAAISLVCLAALSGCVKEKEFIEIEEKLFITQTNEVYLNQESYLEKRITLEGLFKMEHYAGSVSPYFFVLRYGPGCCGNDGNAGFEVAWDKDAADQEKYPAVDDWVRAEGILKQYNEDGGTYLYIALSKLDVLEERGAEFVTR
ncbi:MAG: metal ABC transporter permease [Treponema sp.]|jgi:zinc transport system permease protein|nr:metal ABC transporter permease [Treponema sp.]